jgi:enamine deaminase RidA (YjgF/YER057c/UK114 family)
MKLSLTTALKYLLILHTTIAFSNTMDVIQARLDALGFGELPPPGAPKANYQLIHRDGDTLFLSGHLPIKSDGSIVIGACAPSHVIEGDTSGKWLSTEQGYKAAQHCALNLLSTLQSYLTTQSADLSNVVKIVKLFGIVRSHDEFVEQHLVMNGASDLLGNVLGSDVGGCHARSAIGTNTLPLGICVEVEMIAKISVH